MTSKTDKTSSLIKTFHADQLRVSVHRSTRQMAAAAASEVTVEMRRLIAERGRAIALFASGSSKEAREGLSEFLDCLVKTAGIEWTRVIGFQLEEYVGLDEDAAQSVRRFLLDRLVTRVPMAEFHGIRGEAANPAAVCDNYAALLGSRPPDFAVLGIDEDGRLGFDCSPAGGDPNPARVVKLDKAFRLQQVRDGLFTSLAAAPRRAISLALPAILACPRLFAIASGAKMSQAVRDCLQGKIATTCPASLLRTHAGADLFLDRDAAAMLLNKPEP